MFFKKKRGRRQNLQRINSNVSKHFTCSAKQMNIIHINIIYICEKIMVFKIKPNKFLDYIFVIHNFYPATRMVLGYLIPQREIEGLFMLHQPSYITIEYSNKFLRNSTWRAKTYKGLVKEPTLCKVASGFDFWEPCKPSAIESDVVSTMGRFIYCNHIIIESFIQFLR